MTTIDMTTAGGITFAVLPELVLTVAALIALLAAAWLHSKPDGSSKVGKISLWGVVAAIIALAVLWSLNASPLESARMMALDSFRYSSALLILLTTAAVIALSLGYLKREQITAPEFYPLVLFAAVGMLFLAGAADLIVVFLGLEVMSIAVYVLAGYDRRSSFSAEAALKYFLIGAFASAFLLYGIALIYGATGTTNLVAAGKVIGVGQLSIMASLGLGMLIIGLGFKVAAVPMHMWAPDVYDGSPTPITAFMATGVKAAGFVILGRILFEVFGGAVGSWTTVIGVLAIATMVVGNLVALRQRSLKRMLAYSSIAHAGYLLAAIWSGPTNGAGPLLLYLWAYVITTIATFGLLGYLGIGGERDVSLDSIAGLGRHQPIRAVGLSLCMLSLLGFPGTIGFIGKWFIISGVVSQDHAVLAVVMVLTSLVSAGYYLPVVAALWLKEPHVIVGPESGPVPTGTTATISLAAIMIVLFGVWPGWALAQAVNWSAELTVIGRSLAHYLGQ